MTLANEELNALKNARRFIVDNCIWQSKWSMLKMILSGKFQAWRKEAYYTLKHYPAGSKLDRLYESEVCLKCYNTKHFCKCNKKD